MSRQHKDEFPEGTKNRAFARQGSLCASCGTKIDIVGLAGRATHKYGESSEAHHMKHVQQGGTKELHNCVILCKSCHYNVHNGGQFRIHKGREMEFKYLITSEFDYPFFQKKG